MLRHLTNGRPSTALNTTLALVRGAGLLATLAFGCGGEPLDATPAASAEETAPLTGLTVSAPPSLAVAPPVISPVKRLCGLRLLSPPAAENFDAGGTDGWQVVGTYDASTMNRVATVGPVAAPFWDTTNEPAAEDKDPIDGRGSAIVVFTFGGMPATTSGQWRQDLVSPDVSHIDGWQGRGNFSFGILDSATFDGTPLQAQVTLDVLKCDGTTALVSQTNPLCSTVPGAWTTCNAQVSLTGVDTIRHVEVRVFGQSRFDYEGFVYVDQIHVQ